MKTFDLTKIIAAADRPRRGQAFSFAPGPFARRQKQWKTHLPWEIHAVISDDKAKALQAAFGIDIDHAEGKSAWQTQLNLFTRGQLYLRAIPLSIQGRYPITPGPVRRQQRARLRRWLPQPFTGRSEKPNLFVTWCSPVRFASPSRAITVPPRRLLLLPGEISHVTYCKAMREYDGVARWLDDGWIYLFFEHGTRKTQ